MVQRVENSVRTTTLVTAVRPEADHHCFSKGADGVLYNLTFPSAVEPVTSLEGLIKSLD